MTTGTSPATGGCDMDMEWIAPPQDAMREFYERAGLQQAIEEVAEAARRDPAVLRRLREKLGKEVG